MENTEEINKILEHVPYEKTVTMPATTARRFYRQCVEIFQPMLQLRKREADVFAELLYHNYSKRSIADKEDRAKLVFDISTRKKMQDYLKVSNPVIQQALGGLRKKGLVKGIYIRDFFEIEPKDGVFSLTFNFVVNGDATNS